jgi:hypothetical protein
MHIGPNRRVTWSVPMVSILSCSLFITVLAVINLNFCNLQWTQLDYWLYMSTYIFDIEERLGEVDLFHFVSMAMII